MTCRLIKTACTASAVVLTVLAATPLLAAPAAATDCVAELVCPPTAPGPGPAPTPAPQPKPDPEPKPKPEPEPPREQPSPTTTTAPPRQTRSAEEATAALLTLLNKERAAGGLPLMQRRRDVDGIAAGWSKHLAAEGRLSHNDNYFSASTRRRLDARALGENVAHNNSPEAAHAALMASPPHRANILDPRFTVVGLGAVEGHGSWWITQNFMQPRQARVVATQSAPASPAHSTGRRAIRPTITGGGTASTSIDVATTPPTKDTRLESQSAGILPMPEPGGRAWGAATLAATLASAGWWLTLTGRRIRRGRSGPVNAL